MARPSVETDTGSSRLYSMVRNIKWEYLVAGISGGVVSTLVLHPLDLVKIRFQVNEGYGVTKRPKYNGIVHALRSIARSDGFVGLYQGVTPNIWGAGMSWGLYFFFYNSIKTKMNEGDSKRNLGPGCHIMAATGAGFTTLVLTNPIWVTKTRLCLQYDKPGAPTSSVHYKGMADALFKIYKFEGIRGLYKGFVPGVFGISHGALQFMAYEEMKTVYNTYRNQANDTRLGSAEYVVFAALSKMFAASTTYPYQVLRSRIQDQHREYGGIRDIIRQIFKYEGIRGLYKGLGVYLWHVTPNICIVFLLYEYITNWKSSLPENHS
ncbi:mitochondrial folate transporter/carrier-like isoform X1 [Haliotis rufescens]|uniref:mitochondrial folate transporter/carrier-like isoform X1 n=1 Tax=Haliotis rufescens TaxID=6454 RepID=UPI001EB039C1|nr:mitochondrial folate transporter/carrier-like isoform X1 [Haliotis rufescens]